MPDAVSYTSAEFACSDCSTPLRVTLYVGTGKLTMACTECRWWRTILQRKGD